MQVATDSASRAGWRDGISTSASASRAGPVPHRVGPNTLIQTIAAVRLRRGRGWATHLASRANLPEPLPRDMVDERAFARLVRVLVDDLGADAAEEILADAGVGTGRYVLGHRIPGPARSVLRRLPRRLALRILLRAVRAHAWTFAGSAPFATCLRPEGAEFTLAPSLVCETARCGRPMGSYYARAVEVLVRALVAPSARVLEDACVATGGDCCRFRVVLAPPASHAPLDDPTEGPCASS